MFYHFPKWTKENVCDFCSVNRLKYTGLDFIEQPGNLSILFIPRKPFDSLYYYNCND